MLDSIAAISFGIIIPARYASTRFPGKPLQDLGGKSMIQRVVEAAKASNPTMGVAVATDDLRIADHIRPFCEVVMTDANHPSGTDRCAEALDKLGWDCDVVVNLQGDEPFIKSEQVALLVSAFENPNTEIATLKIGIQKIEEIQNPNVVKVVCDCNDQALYFSRLPIPFNRNGESQGAGVQYYRHIGMYAFKADALRKVAQLSPSTLEQTEMLEQLRWLENGMGIGVKETTWASPAIDTPEDLEKALKFV